MSPTALAGYKIANPTVLARGRRHRTVKTNRTDTDQLKGPQEQETQ